MKFVSLLSSGIDSPVASYLISKKAGELILVHADNRPFTDEREINNFLELAKKIKSLFSGKIKVYIVPHGPSLNEFLSKCNPRFTCVFCKRMLLSYAEKIAELEEADAIVMGDSLGQVASQTLQNIKTIEEFIKIPILRPLIGLDKEDVINIAKDIGTFELSIQKSDGCKAVPQKPATMAKKEQIFDEESKINVKKLIAKAVRNSKKISI